MTTAGEVVPIGNRGRQTDRGQEGKTLDMIETFDFTLSMIRNNWHIMPRE